jgi:hypothetical protein
MRSGSLQTPLFSMKHSFHPHQALIIVPPLWVLTLFCLAQDPKPVAGPMNEAVMAVPRDEVVGAPGRVLQAAVKTRTPPAVTGGVER